MTECRETETGTGSRQPEQAEEEEKQRARRINHQLLITEQFEASDNVTFLQNVLMWSGDFAAVKLNEELLLKIWFPHVHCGHKAVM